MDVIDYINTITTNSFSDWVRFHNDILHNDTNCTETNVCNDLYDKEIRIIGHILKVLYNEKISTMNKFYLLISIEENLEYFIKNENGAIHLLESLTTDLKNSLISKWDYRYVCQLVIVICSASVYYDIFISYNQKCSSFINRFLTILFDIISNDSTTTNWTNLKFTALSSMLHLESTYPTLLSPYESKLTEIVQREKSIYFELLLQLHSLVFKNSILNKCRLQRSASFISGTSLDTEVYDCNQIRTFILWIQERDVHEEKIVGSQSSILKSLRTILDQAMAYLSPLGINVVASNCLTVTKCLSQNTASLWTPFIGRFICSQNLNILESLMSLKMVTSTCSVKEGILSSEQLQETLFSVLNNCKLSIPRRQVAALWLYNYPIDEHIVHSVTVNSKCSETYSCIFEPELIRHLYLRSIEILEIKYCKLMLLNRAIKTSKLPDCNSCLLYSSLKEIIKSLHYFDTDMPPNILLRVMFAMHVRHPNSVLARDFESCLESIVIRYPTILSSIMLYLNALEKHAVSDEQCRNFSVKCLTQIAKLSSEKLSTLTNITDFSSIMLHVQVLNYIIKFTDIDLAEYLELLRDLLISSKANPNIKWFEQAYDLILNLCFNIIKKYGSSKFYQELTNILNEIRNELFGSGTEIKANFLYALIVSLPSKKISALLLERTFEEINEKDFELIRSCLIQSYLDDYMLTMDRKTVASTLQMSRYQYDDLHNGYFDFLQNHLFTIVYDVELMSKPHVTMETFLCGVSVDFPTDNYYAEIVQWHVPFIRCNDENSFNIQKRLEVTIKEPESFAIWATLAATKLDGTFIIYSIETEKIDLMDLALEIPIAFPSTDSKKRFVNYLLKEMLPTRSFVSINFVDKTRLEKFNNIYDKFVVVKDNEYVVYLMFLPPHYHILFRTFLISSFCWRFDVYTDLKMINLLSIEQSLKEFEL